MYYDSILTGFRRLLELGDPVLAKALSELLDRCPCLDNWVSTCMATTAGKESYNAASTSSSSQDNRGAVEFMPMLFLLATSPIPCLR